MDFIPTIPILINLNGDNYNSFLVIINQQIKIVYYKPVNIIFNTSKLAKVIIDMIIYYYNLLDLIVIYKGSFFTSKFESLFYYFLNINQKFFFFFSSLD